MAAGPSKIFHASVSNFKSEIVTLIVTALARLSNEDYLFKQSHHVENTYVESSGGQALN